MSEDKFNVEGVDSAPDSFALESSTVNPTNRASNINMAAHSALLSDKPELVAQTYDEILGKLEEGEDRESVDRIFQLTNAQQAQASRQALTDLLSDPNVPDDVKESAALGVLDIKNSQFNMRNELARQALIQEDESENRPAERVRIDIAEVVETMNETKAEQQRMLNSHAANVDTETGKALREIVELYMVPFVDTAFSKKVTDGFLSGDDGSWWTNLFPGSAKKKVRNALNEMPAEVRLEMTEELIKVVQESSNVILTGENEFAQVEFLRSVLEDGHYGEVDVWIDNIVSVLDLVGLGALAKSGLKTISRSMFKSGSQPASVVNNLKDTNLSKYREAVDAAAESSGDEVAEQLGGTSKGDLVADATGPEVAPLDGRYKHKPSAPNAIEEIRSSDPGELLELLGRNGYTHFTEAEKRAARANVINDFNQMVGLRPRSEMDAVQATDQGVKVEAFYGPSKAGYTRPDVAVHSAERAFSDYGITEGNGLVLMRRDGDAYVETTLAEEIEFVKAKEIIEEANPGVPVRLKRQQDYLIKVDYDYKFSQEDVGYQPLSVKRNLFDKLGVGLSDSFGSLNRHLFDPASMLEGTIWKSANVAIDKAAEVERRLLGLAADFANDFVKYDKADQEVMFDLIKKANDESKEISHADMVNADLTEAQMGTLNAWKRYWDVQYVLENQDAGKTLRAQGFRQLVDENSDSIIFGREVSRARVGARTNVLDPTTGEVRTFTSDQLDELYETGGTVVQTKLPLNLPELDSPIDLVLATGQEGGAYTRAITDSTPVLNYRPGYFTRRYKDPYFVEQIVRDSQGNELYRRAVATSESFQEAELRATELDATTDANVSYRARPDRNFNEVQDFDNFFGVEQAKGRIAQRYRGKRLEDANGSIDDLSQARIEGPVDSMLAQARSISNRVPMREVLEAHKSRALQQYADYMPRNDFGQPTWPTSVKQIRNYGDRSDSMKDAGDARTTFEYINYLENGYINSIDDGYRAFLKSVGQMTGERGWKAIEKASHWGAKTRGPSAMGKNAAFNLYLAANPFRQFVIQSHQAVQLAANFGDYFASARMVPEIMTLLSYQAGTKPAKSVLKGLGLTEDQALEMFNSWKASGLAASIDKQNLVRGSLADLADEMADSKFRRGINKVGAPLRISRKLGFDSGEYVNLMTSWLAHRHRALTNGQDVTLPSVLDDIAAKSRNYTYNMNAAGDMPYNQNALALVFQFMQVPHKALTTMTTNRDLKFWEKTRLVGFNAAMYSLPPAVIYSIFGSVLPEDPTAQDFIVNGVEGATFNLLLSKMSGEEVRVNWEGLAPVDMHGQLEFMTNLLTSDIGTILAETPSGSLLFGRSPRIADFMGTVARATNVIDDFSDPTQLSDVAIDGAKLFSGLSNAFKAAYMLEYQKKISSFGGVTDRNVKSAEAIAQVFGFTTLDSARKFWIDKKSYDASKSLEADVTEWWDSYRKHITRKGVTPDEISWITKSHSEAWRVWGNDSRRAKDILAKLIRRDLRTSYDTYNSILKSHEILGVDELRTVIEQMPDVTDSDRERMFNMLKAVESLGDLE